MPTQVANYVLGPEESAASETATEDIGITSRNTFLDVCPSEPLDVCPSQPEEYHVLLRNLPQSLLKESMLREMVKKAQLTGIKKLSFRSDGRALISLISYDALNKCINHFDGLPWFHAPTCAVPYVTASRVQIDRSCRKTHKSSAAAFSADAAVFVPCSIKAGSKTHFSADAPAFVPSSEKISSRDRLSSHASTDVGPSSENASDRCDSEIEVQVACT